MQLLQEYHPQKHVGKLCYFSKSLLLFSKLYANYGISHDYAENPAAWQGDSFCCVNILTLRACSPARSVRILTQYPQQEYLKSIKSIR